MVWLIRNGGFSRFCALLACSGKGIMHMLFRTGSAIAAAIIGAASVFSLVGTGVASALPALAASQPTGSQLKSALLPPSDLGSGYSVAQEADTGKKLERTQRFNIASMACGNLWSMAGGFSGFGENAHATDTIDRRTAIRSGSSQVFYQAIYQFPGTKKAASFFSAADSRFGSCHTAADAAPGVTTVHIAIRSQSNAPALAAIQAFRDGRIVDGNRQVRIHPASR